MSMKLADHPTVKAFHEKAAADFPPSRSPKVDADWVRQVCREAGAVDVGFVEIGRPALDDHRQDILKAFPHTKTLISFVVRMKPIKEAPKLRPALAI
jgi:hypothetical protein